MEFYRSKDNHVTKYVHDDGSETAIKTTPIETFGGIYGKVTNKYNVFISMSVGCVVGCKFCYLTTKKCPYVTLSTDTVVYNVITAIENEVEDKPEIRTMYTKLSWMGMGDAYLDMEKMYEASVQIAALLEERGLSAGIDGIDISTTLPKVPTIADDYIGALSLSINVFRLNPERHYHEIGSRNPIRVFYSLHSALEATRTNLIPNTQSLLNASDYLVKLVNKSEVTLVIHHMFFEGINDSVKEMEALKNFLVPFKDIELRLLRFNKCEGTTFKESNNFNNLVDELYKTHKNIKVQSSPGAEIHAACGQFLLSKIKEIK